MAIRMRNGIKRARENSGWTQAHLAEQLGVDDTTLSKWESGHVVPDVFKQRLARLFNMAVYELFFFETVKEIAL